MSMHPDDRNVDDLLEFIDGRNVVLKGFHAIIVARHHRLFVIVELLMDTEEQYNWASKNIELLITMLVDGKSLYSSSS